MKNILKFEILEISQEKAIGVGLKLPHLVLIDYLYQFFSSGCAKIIHSNSKIYFYITLNKILLDLPILNIKKRRLQELISDLDKFSIIERFSSKSSPNNYIHLNLSSILP